MDPITTTGVTKIITQQVAQRVFDAAKVNFPRTVVKELETLGREAIEQDFIRLSEGVTLAHAKVRRLAIEIFLASQSSTSATLIFNLSWLSKNLPEEYRAHFLDQHSEMIAAGERTHVIRRKLLWYWFIAAVWTPTVSRLQSLIPPNRISS